MEMSVKPRTTEPPARPSERLVRYRDLFDAIDQGFCLIEVLFDASGRPIDYRFLEVNASFAAQTGLTDAVGRTMRSLRPNHETHWFEIYGRVALTGEPRRFERQAAALGRWYDVYAFRVGEPEQRTVAILFSDITDRKRAEEKLALLTAEIDHRGRNLLTIVMGMAQLTKADTVAEYRSKLIGRLGALARSQRLLSEQNLESGSLEKLIEEELSGHVARGEGRATWHGPSIMLNPAIVQCMAMTVHELATNATKYGALSVPNGQVEIRWHWRDDGRLAVRWAERGGPPVGPPEREGTGTRVILRCIRDQLGGEVTFAWLSSGLVCELTVPAPARATSTSKAP
jgi:PAS domain S-box-containing protein